MKSLSRVAWVSCDTELTGPSTVVLLISQALPATCACRTTDLMSALDAAQSELQAAKSMQHQAASRQPEQRASREQEQPGMTLLKQQITQLEAEAAQLRADNQQLVQQRLQGRSLLDNQGPRPPSEHSKELDEPQPVQAGIVLRNDAHILGNDSQVGGHWHSAVCACKTTTRANVPTTNNH